MVGTKLQTLLVDDHPLFRAGLAVVLDRDPALHVCGESGTADEALELVRAGQVDLAVVDVLMPAGTGMSLATALLDIKPDLTILALSVLDEPVVIASMLRAGARGYSLKTQPPSEIVEAVHAVHRGERYLPPQVSKDAVLALVRDEADRPLRRLTRREREIFDLLVRGLSNEEVASKLFIARRTVETHRQRIMKKLAVHSIREMIRIAARQGALLE